MLPYANANAMTLHLAEVSRSVAAGAHALLICDGAGWHQTGGRLRVPDNITLLHLPPYSPELNPVENVWEYLRANKLSNSVFDTYDTIVDRCCATGTGLPKRQTASDPSQPRPGPKRSMHRTVGIINLDGCSYSRINRLLSRFGQLASMTPDNAASGIGVDDAWCWHTSRNTQISKSG